MVSVCARNNVFLAFACLLNVLALVGGSPSLARAQSLDAPSEAFLASARDRALRNYGWKPEAIRYIAAHTRLLSTPGGIGSPCPAAVACSLRNGSVYVNMVPDDPRDFDYVLNHEFMHSMEYARGSSDGTVGRILADVLTLSNDAEHLAAAYAARRVLGLSGRDDHPVITDSDWFHIEHDVLEDVGWDVAALPAWYREAYFPYLSPGPSARTSVTLAPAQAPRDTDLRTQRVLDTIVKLCGPVLPGARLSAPSVSCGPAALWSGVPYGPMVGGAAPPVVIAVAPSVPPVASAPTPPVVASAPTQPAAPAAVVSDGAALVVWPPALFEFNGTDG